ncbi:MAG: hypothetical protein QOH68_721 [Nocardioidaceae bacterium]|jgi:tetratricopeptide (TPR) repeat protein|nr:hypothetical protein [Nocardioidaceae bacterium]
MSNRLTVARHHVENGNPSLALEVIAQLDDGELEGAASEAHEIAAGAHRDLGDHDSARDEAKRSLELEPTNVDALLVLARSSYELGDHKTVAPSMSRARELAPDNVVVLVESANLLINRGRFVKAAELLRRAAVIAPDSLIVRAGFMEHAFARHERDRARALAREVLAENPDHVRALAVDAALAGRSAREAAVRSRPLLRPAWWFFRHRWVALFTIITLIRLVLAASLLVRDGDLPWWSAGVPGVVALYLVGSMTVVHRMIRPRLRPREA